MFFVYPLCPLWLIILPQGSQSPTKHTVQSSQWFIYQDVFSIGWGALSSTDSLFLLRPYKGIRALCFGNIVLLRAQVFFDRIYRTDRIRKMFSPSYLENPVNPVKKFHFILCFTASLRQRNRLITVAGAEGTPNAER